jgi:hypothetical protein
MHIFLPGWKPLKSKMVDKSRRRDRASTHSTIINISNNPGANVFPYVSVTQGRGAETASAQRREPAAGISTDEESIHTTNRVHAIREDDPRRRSMPPGLPRDLHRVPWMSADHSGVQWQQEISAAVPYPDRASLDHSYGVPEYHVNYAPPFALGRNTRVAGRLPRRGGHSMTSRVASADDIGSYMTYDAHRRLNKRVSESCFMPGDGRTEAPKPRVPLDAHILAPLAVHFWVWDRTVCGPVGARLTIVCPAAHVRTILESRAPEGSGRMVAVHVTAESRRVGSLALLDEILPRGEVFWVEISDETGPSR